MSKNKELSILGHLNELKNRLLKSVAAIIVTSIIAFVFADQIFYVLTLPIEGTPLIYIDITEMIGIYMKVCLAAGIFLAMPFLVYQGIMFIAPALTQKEKGYVYIVLPWIFFMFVAGVAFSYFVLLPPAFRFLTTFGSDIATPQIRIGSYISVVTRLMLATGVVFELPVITTFLARIGILTSNWLARKRKWAIILAFVAGAIITPTFDPFNQILMSAPLIALYEMSIWLAKLVQKRRAQTALAEPSPLS